MTDAEKALWKVLRSRQVSGLKFRRQHGEQVKYDDIRTKNLTKTGFRVLRFWNTEVLQEIEAVKERIWQAVEEQQAHPHPDPPLEGEGI
jgi:adenine-specific DNA-methyltransferase